MLRTPCDGEVSGHWSTTWSCPPPRVPGPPLRIESDHRRNPGRVQQAPTIVRILHNRPDWRCYSSHPVVTAKTQYSLSNALGYFREHLAIGDYYQEGQKIAGEWYGIGARSLGLEGRIREPDFLALCENQRPDGDGCLTQRTNSVRRKAGSAEANRRIFYDFTFSPPKSVSIAALIGEDKRILAAHDRAIRVALGEFETFAATRVRKSGRDASRMTGNVVTALFTHDTSRTLDPHLHTHCIVFNATYDPAEKRWKALQNYEMLRARKYAEAVYYHELARDLTRIGYEVRNRPRGDFEVVGVPEAICRRFSKRHRQIDEALDALLREKPELGEGNIKSLREHLATAERSRKIHDQDPETLRRVWRAQLTPAELSDLQGIARRESPVAAQESSAVVAEEAVNWAEEHLFDRHSAVPEHEIWQAAIEYARGRNVSPTELRHVTAGRGYIRKEDDPGLVTTHEVLRRELEIVEMARRGISGFLPLLPEIPGSVGGLEEEQKVALNRLLTTRDFITIFRGAAGSGKSFVLRHVGKALEAAGYGVVALAPQTQQVMDLERDGFRQPKTIAEFLTRRTIAGNAIVLVDEAGQVGGRQMSDLVKVVASHGGRLILSGDTRQHGPVEASDMLLALERYAELRPAQLETIRRQDPKLAKARDERRQIGQYRGAVKAAAAGRLSDSFERLNRMGAIVACPLGDQQDRLAEEFVRLSGEGLSSVVVAQTWSEVHRVNERVRGALKTKGLIGNNDREITALERIDLTTAQKGDSRFHAPDQVAVLNRPIGQMPSGTQGKIVGAVKRGVLIEVGGRMVLVQSRYLDRLTVCRPLPVKVAVGDRLHIRANRRMADGSRMVNGELVSVTSVDTKGSIGLADGRNIDPSFREFVPGYAVTSYAAQGKTVDFVLFSDSAVRAATDRRQWYVTISRGRRGIRIFTPDKAQLRQNVVRSGDQPLALDLVRPELAFGRGVVMAGWERWLASWSGRAQTLLSRILHRERFHPGNRLAHEHHLA